jgi:hypothetical protein
MNDNFDVSDYGEGIGALSRRADSLLMRVNTLRRVNFLNYQWRKFFPDSSYKEITDYAVKGIDVLAETASMQESNDVPQIEFLEKKQNMPFHDEEAMIQFSRNQIDLFRLVDSTFLAEAVSLVDKKISAVYQVAGKMHNNIFFKGNEKISGLFQNPFIVDITGSVPPTEDFVQWFAQAAMVAGTETNDKISTPNIYISPSMSAQINSYSSGTDRSLLDKIEAVRISSQGETSNLKIRVLSYLQSTPDDVLFLSDDAQDFYYAYKPLRIRNFRPFGLQSFSALCDFGYTEPLCFKKYAICKATYSEQNVALNAGRV